MKPKACGTCIYYEAISTKVGKCHRYPPSTYSEDTNPEGNYWFLFPEVKTTDWCGEFISIHEEEKCEICGTTKDLKCCPIMTGDKFDEPPKHPVCGRCISLWYETGITSIEKLKKLALRKNEEEK